MHDCYRGIGSQMKSPAKEHHQGTSSSLGGGGHVLKPRAGDDDNINSMIVANMEGFLV